MNEHIDIEVKRMSKESIEMLNNLSAVCNCKRRVNKA